MKTDQRHQWSDAKPRR